jgi:LysM domain
MSMNYSPEHIQYTIQAGDSIEALAYGFNTTAESILAANPGITPSNLSVGQVLSIPTVYAEQFRRFGPGFGWRRPFFGGPFGYGRFGRPFWGGPWGYGSYWGGYGYPWW